VPGPGSELDESVYPVIAIGAVARGAEQHLAAQAFDGTFYRRRDAAGQWSEWMKILSVAPGTGEPAIAITSDGLLRVFVVDAHSVLWQMTCRVDDCVPPFAVEIIGGEVGPVAATASGQNLLAMLAIRRDELGQSKLWQRQWRK
jgi:hypothetical protein